MQGFHNLDYLISINAVFDALSFDTKYFMISFIFKAKQEGCKGFVTPGKPKVTKIELLATSTSAHEIRLAQQQLLFELTSIDKHEEQSSQTSLEQMTRNELRDLCKQYQIPSSHTNKCQLIERIKQTSNQINYQDNFFFSSYSRGHL